MPNDCPDYYTLADGREFVDFFHQECTPLLTPHFDATEIHCIQSAMEHLYRMGRKTVDPTHDSDAYQFWINKGREFWFRRKYHPHADVLISLNKRDRDKERQLDKAWRESQFSMQVKPVVALVIMEQGKRASVSASFIV